MENTRIIAFDQLQRVFIRSDNITRAGIAVERGELRAEAFAETDGVAALTFVCRRDKVPARFEFTHDFCNRYAIDRRHVRERDKPAIRAAPRAHAVREARAHAARRVRALSNVAAFLFEQIGKRKIARPHYRDYVRHYRKQVARRGDPDRRAVRQRIQQLVAAEA